MQQHDWWEAAFAPAFEQVHPPDGRPDAPATEKPGLESSTGEVVRYRGQDKSPSSAKTGSHHVHARGKPRKEVGR
ncbi:MAG: hypothetical protein U0441_30960 [Polyangiaceae bacterium]